MNSLTGPSFGHARSGRFRFAGSALPKVSRTIRRCTPNWLLIPVNVVTDSDLIPGSDCDAMPVTIGAKRRW
jgi:hypothetical protein